MKYPVFFLFLNSLCPFTTNAQVTTNIIWTEKTTMNPTEVIYFNATKKLGWADFKGVPGPAGPVAAITSSGFGYRASMNSTNGKGNIEVFIYCYFSKTNSWVKPGSKTAYILTHEQHHFDASYLAAKLFFDKVKASRLSFANADALLAKLYKDCCNYMNQMQNEYDGETMNGQLKDKQVKWNAFFDDKLLNGSTNDLVGKIIY